MSGLHCQGRGPGEHNRDGKYQRLEHVEVFHTNGCAIIYIHGGRETVAIVDRAYPADVGEGIIRIDGIIRRNARTGIGELVIVSKADVKEAKKITIAPAQQGIMIQANPEVFKQGLLGRVVLKADIVSQSKTIIM